MRTHVATLSWIFTYHDIVLRSLGPVATRKLPLLFHTSDSDCQRRLHLTTRCQLHRVTSIRNRLTTPIKVQLWDWHLTRNLGCLSPRYCILTVCSTISYDLSSSCFVLVSYFVSWSRVSPLFLLSVFSRRLRRLHETLFVTELDRYPNLAKIDSKGQLSLAPAFRAAIAAAARAIDNRRVIANNNN